MTAAPAPSATGPALGSVVGDALGLRWQVHADPYDLGLDALVGLALRDNPRRAQLVVSRVLAKHLPVAPDQARRAGDLLARLVRDALGDGGPAPVVLGFCETATALGHLVAEHLPAEVYVHTTRRPEPGVPVLAGFDEEHSHAVAHALQLRDPAVLVDPDRPVVLVDDELSTGRTALNTVQALTAVAPHARWVVATLLDLRPAAEREQFRARAAELGVRVEVVALLDGELALPPDLAERAAALRRVLAEVPPAPLPRGGGAPVSVVAAPWPVGVPLGGRTGTRPGEQEAALAVLADRVAGRVAGGRTLVLGTEELMWLPLRLAGLLPGDAVCASTTRSPVLAADLPGYAVRRALVFPAVDDPSRTSRLHGLPETPYDDVVVVTDAPAVGALPLAEQLRPWATAGVTVVALGAP